MAAPRVGGDPYKNPELFRFVGSMEGVPDWVDAAHSSMMASVRLARGSAASGLERYSS